MSKLNAVIDVEKEYMNRIIKARVPHFENILITEGICNFIISS